MPAENTGGGEFAQLMTYHVLGHINRDEFVAIMHGDGLSYKIRRDHRGSGPSLDRNLLLAFRSGQNFLF